MPSCWMRLCSLLVSTDSSVLGSIKSEVKRIQDKHKELGNKNVALDVILFEGDFAALLL